MSKNNKVWIFAIFILLISVIAGCSNKEKAPEVTNNQPLKSGFVTYTNSEFGFSVDYPAVWNDSTLKQRDRWAITDENKNAILFISQPNPEGKSLEELAISQARQDFNFKNMSSLQVASYIQKIKADNTSWYTYAIGYKASQLESIVSGTVCGNNQVNVILVANTNDFNTTKLTYTKILQSFKCEEKK